MIGKISGIVDTINADSVLVNVVGVGYIINVSENKHKFTYQTYHHLFLILNEMYCWFHK